LRALKTLVIVLGILIVAGLGLVGYVLVKRGLNSAPPQPVASAAAPAAPIAAETPYGPIAIELPAGAKIASTHVTGGRLVVELAMPNGAERVLALDLADGRLIGTIDLKPQP